MRMSLAQVSMDGSNVNWKMYNHLCKDVNEQRTGKKLLTVRSCGIHVTHNTFCRGCGASGSN